MAFKFPFTNYHELNLTWVLDQLKSLFEKSEENVTVIENYNGRLTAVETELPLVEETAQGASQQAAAAATLAQRAKSTADTAQENAIQAQGLAGTARQEAQAAQSAADAAIQAAQQAQATAQNFDGRITQAENDASQALEASRSFENRVQSAITTANNAAQTATTAQGIATRADQNAALALDTLKAQRSELERIGAEQVERITEETESGKTEIENLAQSVLDSIPSDYTALSNLVDKKAPVIINSASGAVASFNDGADNMKIQKLAVNIEPVQAGSGDPSPDNVRPISGYTGVEIEHTGKNMFNQNAEPHLLDVFQAGGTPSQRRKGFIIKLPDGNYVFSAKRKADYTTGAFLYLNKVNSDGTFNEFSYFVGGSTQHAKYNVTLENGQYILFYDAQAPAESSSTKFEGFDIWLTKGSTATAYEPYTSNQISVTFPSAAGTVYGGTLTINPDRTGTLVVNRADSTQTFQLTESEISGVLSTLYGNNNIWTDAGPVSVDYPADTKLYIDGKLAELQATILENI